MHFRQIVLSTLLVFQLYLIMSTALLYSTRRMGVMKTAAKCNNLLGLTSIRSSLSSSTDNHKSSSPTPQYSHLDVEKKWQKYWDEKNTFVSIRRPGKPKKYVLDMFPYPSGAGLHVGHPEGYTATDIMSRFWRMQGYDVLHPMGWDAFGLPAEQHAINTGTHPAVTTYENIATFKRQLKSLGFSYDW